MPRRPDLQTIFLIGSGPIVIGQACEFDYSGTQALKALRGEGCRVVLLNNNPATIMTDPDLADRTYLEPMTVDVAESIIRRERPDALLPTMGGQTALNLAMDLDRAGILERYGVELIGAQRAVIERAEDRMKFKETVQALGLDVPRSDVVRSVPEAMAFADEVGLPLILRPSFTMGGVGGGIVEERDRLAELVDWGIRQSPTGEVLIEESLLGWKEFELEIMRDRADNFVVICSIENLDPMGTHTGDSITVAPAQTLTDREYQAMRDEAAACARAIGVDTGGANIQFAVDPHTGRRIVIEMNPRVSRSSALASKATGFPIAKIAALLALGYTLDELKNDITGVMPASFEPSLDYVAVKVPRFNFEKFPDTPRELGSQMRSVGEALGLGRTFKEALQKALRSLDAGWDGFRRPPEEIGALDGGGGEPDWLASMGVPRPDRLQRVYHGLRRGLSVEDVAAASGYDAWFVQHLSEIVGLEAALAAAGGDGSEVPPELLRRAKAWGFSDAQIAAIRGEEELDVERRRRALGIEPRYRSVDTCAGEFPARTPYLYSTYDNPPVWRLTAGDELVAADEGMGDVSPLAPPSVLILGAGPNRIGQGLEFDSCCVHAVQALRRAGYRAIMLNANPETVSTDYETCDRLYFEPITVEDVMNVWRAERPLGVVLQFGGQTPLRLAADLEARGVRILGTSLEAIDRAEDRDAFESLIRRLGLNYPRSACARSVDEARAAAGELGFPLLVRPSFVLGGRGMHIAYGWEDFDAIVNDAVGVRPDRPISLDHFLEGAVEVDVDALSDGRRTVIAGILEHIEEAGVHSGDSACVFPPYTLAEEVVHEIARQTVALSEALGVLGMLNIQFCVLGEKIYVLEVNPRASRTVPFISKVTGVAWAAVAARCLVGERLEDLLPAELLDRRGVEARALWAVKEPVFPFDRFPGADTLLGPEMRSTGEAIGMDGDFATAFAKSQASTSGRGLPRGGTACFSVRDEDKEAIVYLARRLAELGFRLVATRGTARVLRGAGLPVEPVLKVSEGRPHIVDRIEAGEVDLVVNTVQGRRSHRDSASLRRAALLRGVPYFTTIPGASAAVGAIETLGGLPWGVQALQDGPDPLDRRADRQDEGPPSTCGRGQDLLKSAHGT